MKYFLSTIFAFLYLSSIAQIDFNNYQPLQSAGPVPLDFSTPTRVKISTASTDHLTDLSKKKKEDFILQTNYTIDELLESGMVTFGDPVTQYIEKIGNRLTAGNSELEGKLRYYTYNSNDANAFSTDQGMVFVTTGLIAQLTSEAQLAYVLAHEIIHYQRKHVYDLYNYQQKSTKMSYSEKVRFFSSYSRENELEADKLGVELYYKAGYSKNEILKTFDVLIYSYLPFEEVAFDKTYFNTEQFYVPDFVFNTTKNPITAQIKYDDKLQSHPNVAKRQEQLNLEVEKFPDWKTEVNPNPAVFFELRDLCRFEFVLNDLYEKNNIEALYSIYILEKKYPNSGFLKTSKAQAWLYFMNQKKARNTYNFNSDRYYNNSSFEGQISVFARGIANLTSLAKSTFGLRIIYDIYHADTTNNTNKRIYEKSLELLALNESFELNRFSENNFDCAIEELDKQRFHLDTLPDSLSTQNWNKYETILNEKKGISLESGIDSSWYFLYGLSDVISDSAFLKGYTVEQKKLKDKELKDEELFLMTDDEQIDFYGNENSERLHLELDSVLMLNPFVVDFKKYKRVDYLQSEVLEKRFITSVKNTADDFHLTVNYLDRTNQQTITTQELNDLGFLMRSAEKAVEDRNDDVFIMDQAKLDSIRFRYHSDKLIVFDYQHMYDPNITVGSGILFTVLFPVGLIYFPAAILSGHESQFDTYVFDLKKGEVIVKTSYYSHDSDSKKMIDLRLNALFNQLTQKKNETY